VRSTVTLRRIVFSPCTKRTFKVLSKIEIATKLWFLLLSLFSCDWKGLCLETGNVYGVVELGFLRL
jgi:hypothetical protein